MSDILTREKFKTRVRELGLGTVRLGESSKWVHSDVLFAHDQEQRDEIKGLEGCLKCATADAEKYHQEAREAQERIEELEKQDVVH